MAMRVEHDRDYEHDLNDPVCRETGCQRCGCCEHCQACYCPCDDLECGCGLLNQEDEEPDEEDIKAIFEEMMWHEAMRSKDE